MWSSIRYLDRVLRGEATRPGVLRGGEIGMPVGGLTIVGAALGGLYGLCMGSYALFQHGDSPFAQLLATAVKVPVLFFLTLAITLPSLYVFNALVGSRLSLLAVLRLLVISLTVMLTVLASLGPIVAFFAASTTNYHFMLVLNVVIFAVSGFLGLRFLVTTLHRMSEAMASAAEFDLEAQAELGVAPIAPLNKTDAPGLSKEVRRVFQIWMLVFGLVGAQMAWVLRPFLGAPYHAFTLFRPRESSFFEAIFTALRHLFS
jgi:hypothetical protein